jgi:hypothetical protein
MTSWWNDWLEKCPVDEMTDWQNDQLLKWPIDVTISHQTNFWLTQLVFPSKQKKCFKTIFCL